MNLLVNPPVVAWFEVGVVTSVAAMRSVSRATHGRMGAHRSSTNLKVIGSNPIPATTFVIFTYRRGLTAGTGLDFLRKAGAGDQVATVSSVSPKCIGAPRSVKMGNIASRGAMRLHPSTRETSPIKLPSIPADD